MLVSLVLLVQSPLQLPVGGAQGLTVTTTTYTTTTILSVLSSFTTRTVTTPTTSTSTSIVPAATVTVYTTTTTTTTTTVGLYTLADFPVPFTSVTPCYVIVPVSEGHGPSGAAHKMDTVGGILIANRLGREGKTILTAMDSYAYISTYDFGTAKVTMTDTTSNLIVIASPGVNQVAYYYNGLSSGGSPVLPVLFLRDGLGDYLYVQSSSSSYRIERNGPGGAISADYAVIQIYKDGGRYVLLVYGLGGEGSKAASIVLQNYDAYGLTGKAVIVKYWDQNVDGYLDTITIVQTVP